MRLLSWLALALVKCMVMDGFWICGAGSRTPDVRMADRASETLASWYCRLDLMGMNGWVSRSRPGSSKTSGLFCFAYHGRKLTNLTRLGQRSVCGCPYSEFRPGDQYVLCWKVGCNHWQSEVVPVIVDQDSRFIDDRCVYDVRLKRNHSSRPHLSTNITPRLQPYCTPLSKQPAFLSLSCIVLPLVERFLLSVELEPVLLQSKCLSTARMSADSLFWNVITERRKPDKVLWLNPDEM